jgi:hypothetical protein
LRVLLGLVRLPKAAAATTEMLLVLDSPKEELGRGLSTEEEVAGPSFNCLG